MELDALFRLMHQQGASDLHLKPHQIPAVRINGEVIQIEDLPAMEPQQLQFLLADMLGDAALVDRRSCHDMAVEVPEVGRFRCNWFRQSGTWALAARRVLLQVPSIQDLRLPATLRPLLDLSRGLVLIGGATGTGKSTSLTAILNHYNQSRRCHIVTLEDPIEYLLPKGKAIVSQRELGIDFDNLPTAIRDAMHQDPDLLLVSELRDAATVEAGLRAAETGHLVFATVHAGSTAQTVNRILDLFEPNRHHQIRHSLAFHLCAVLNQQLVTDASDDSRRIPVVETCYVTPLVRKLILEGKDVRIPEAMKQDHNHGSRTYNQSLAELIRAGYVSKIAALRASPKPEELKAELTGITIEDGRIVG
jgi:twitching motility protein PilT